MDANLDLLGSARFIGNAALGTALESARAERIAEPDFMLWAEQVSSLINLFIRPEDMPGVVSNLSVLYMHAQIVLSVPLPQTTESLAVFQP